MKKILDKVLSPQVFAICYLPWLAINMTSVINVMDFTRFVLIAFAAWAVAIAAKTFFFSGKAPWVEKAQPLLLTFLAACLVSQGLQLNAGGFATVGRLCYFAICLLVLYTQHGCDVEGYRRTMGVLARVMGVVIGVMMAVCDWMFVNLYQGRIEIRNGSNVYLGFAENRLYGIFTSPNVGATYALILIWCSVLVLFWSRDMKGKWLWRVLSVLQIVLATVFISVSLSRGAYVSGGVLVASLLLLKVPLLKNPFLRLWKRLFPKGMGKAVSVALIAVGVAAGILVCVYGVQLVNKLSVKVMTWNHEQQVQSGQVEDTQDTQEIINNAQLGQGGRVEANRQDIDITNKRMTIWTSHLSLLEGKHWLIGVNQPTEYVEANPVVKAGLTELQKSEIARAGGNMHCGYLQILINCGLLAFIPMMAFLAWCAIKAIAFLIATLRGKIAITDPAYRMFSWTLPMVLAILINNVFESNFALMGANFFQAFFWFVAGACVLSMREGAKK